MSMMQSMNQPSKLSPQDLQNYFGWPPPPPPLIVPLNIPTQRQNPVLRAILILVVAFSLCSFADSLSTTLHTSIPMLVFFVLCMIFFVQRVRKKNSVPPPLPSYPAPPPPPPGPSDQEYEDWVRSWQGSIRQYGMQKLGLDANDIQGRPLYVRSIIWPNSYDAKKHYQSHDGPVLIKRGMDGRPHGSVNRFTFFYPTQHYIAVFIYDVNALGSMHFEGTRTYFYDDIVGVDTNSFNLDDGYVTYVMQNFELRVSNGQSIGATTYVHDLDVDQTVNALRTLLRDKKYGIQGGGYGYIGP